MAPYPRSYIEILFSFTVTQYGQDIPRDPYQIRKLSAPTVIGVSYHQVVAACHGHGTEQLKRGVGLVSKLYRSGHGTVAMV